MSAHAPLPPSGAPIWGNCSGSVLAQAAYPDVETPESREGTAAHWVMAEVLLNFQRQDRGPLLCSDYIGRTSPDGVVIDQKMADGADIIVQDVLAVCQKYGCLQDLHIEHRVFMPDIHPQNWGTVDVWVWVPQIQTLFEWDYKHGHLENSAENNLQLINYSKGIVNFLQIDGWHDQQVKVVFRIVNPFFYSSRGPISEWISELSDLRGHYNILRQKAYEAFERPMLSSGPWCTHCKANRNCSAARIYTYNLINVVNRPYEMDDMNGAELAVEYGIVKEGFKVAKARLEALEDELVHRIRGGAADTGLTIESNPGRLKWTCEPGVAIALASQFDVDISAPGVLTPTQAKEKVPRELRENFKQVIKTVTDRPMGELKLVPVANSTGEIEL